MTHPVQKCLRDSGYAPGDALTGGPSSYATARLWLGLAAAVVVCVGATLANYELTFAGGCLGAMLLLAHVEASFSPPLRLAKAGALAATALYRQPVDESDATSDASIAGKIEFAEEHSYRDAPQPKAAVVATSNAPSISWWRALVRYFARRQ